MDHEALINLCTVYGVGPNRARTLLGAYQDPQAVFAAPKRDLVSLPGIDVATAERIKAFRDVGQGKQQVALARSMGVEIVSFWEEAYPENLKNIYDPPVYLYVLGGIEERDRVSVAIVGTRRPSHYGTAVTEQFAKELGGAGITIVSGMARGIDTSAHWGALKAGARTIAVLGSGIDVIYPPENRKLYDRIREDGAVISEFPIGAKPDAINFPRRNRLICGLSLALLVVEAKDRSGALITAEMALEQSREIFAVPGNITEPRSVGPNTLIRDGATMVQSPADVVSVLESSFGLRFSKGESKHPERDLKLSEKEYVLLHHLSRNPVHIDELARHIDMDTSQALVQLLSLEIRGLVRQLPGMNFIRA